jgi:hypothetical protein
MPVDIDTQHYCCARSVDIELLRSEYIPGILVCDLSRDLRGCISCEVESEADRARLLCTSTTKHGIASAAQLSRKSRILETKAEEWRVYSEIISAS